MDEGKGLWSAISGQHTAMNSQCSRELRVVGDAGPGSAREWAFQQSDRDGGGAQGASPLTGELFAIQRSRERGNHCLQLWTQW